MNPYWALLIGAAGGLVGHAMLSRVRRSSAPRRPQFVELPTPARQLMDQDTRSVMRGVVLVAGVVIGALLPGLPAEALGPIPPNVIGTLASVGLGVAAAGTTVGVIARHQLASRGDPKKQVQRLLDRLLGHIRNIEKDQNRMRAALARLEKAATQAGSVPNEIAAEQRVVGQILWRSCETHEKLLALLTQYAFEALAQRVEQRVTPRPEAKMGTEAFERGVNAGIRSVEAAVGQLERGLTPLCIARAEREIVLGRCTADPRTWMAPRERLSPDLAGRGVLSNAFDTALSRLTKAREYLVELSGADAIAFSRAMTGITPDVLAADYAGRLIQDMTDLEANLSKASEIAELSRAQAPVASADLQWGSSVSAQYGEALAGLDKVKADHFPATVETGRCVGADGGWTAGCQTAPPDSPRTEDPA